MRKGIAPIAIAVIGAVAIGVTLLFPLIIFIFIRQNISATVNLIFDYSNMDLNLISLLKSNKTSFIQECYYSSERLSPSCTYEKANFDIYSLLAERNLVGFASESTGGHYYDQVNYDSTGIYSFTKLDINQVLKDKLILITLSNFILKSGDAVITSHGELKNFDESNYMIVDPSLSTEKISLEVEKK